MIPKSATPCVLTINGGGGHRVVHGMKHAKPERITMEELRQSIATTLAMLA
ncbi:MAG: hypothetical protein ABJF10_25405 [Chthoniobacter sp.]|uniref:hypothetical protein n=1 Tax=Chthoniobacter sp. TaxID=2510640 RepID=UPI0032A6B23C